MNIIHSAGYTPKALTLQSPARRARLAGVPRSGEESLPKVKHWKSARATRLKLSPIKEMELAAGQIPNVVSLAQGIPSFDTPEPIKDFVQQKIAEGA